MSIYLGINPSQDFNSIDMSAEDICAKDSKNRQFVRKRICKANLEK